MGYIEIFVMDQNGAGWIDLQNAPENVKLDLEIALLQEGVL